VNIKIGDKVRESIPDVICDLKTGTVVGLRKSDPVFNSGRVRRDIKQSWYATVQWPSHPRTRRPYRTEVPVEHLATVTDYTQGRVTQ
jgi:hypothetical protein